MSQSNLSCTLGVQEGEKVTTGPCGKLFENWLSKDSAIAQKNTGDHLCVLGCKLSKQDTKNSAEHERWKN